MRDFRSLRFEAARNFRMANVRPTAKKGQPSCGQEPTDKGRRRPSRLRVCLGRETNHFAAYDSHEYIEKSEEHEESVEARRNPVADREQFQMFPVDNRLIVEIGWIGQLTPPQIPERRKIGSSVTWGPLLQRPRVSDASRPGGLNSRNLGGIIQILNCDCAERD